MTFGKAATGTTEHDHRTSAGGGRLGPDLQRFAHEQLRMAQAHLARTGDDRHDGVHEARKCLRRTRAVLAIGAKPWRRSIAAVDIELRRICRGLSWIRDAQALVESLVRLEGNSGITADIHARALMAATRRRDEVLTLALRRDADFARRRQRIAKVDTRLAALDWSALDTQAALAALRRSERRLRRSRRQAMAKPEDDARWHTFRRRLRRWRQQITVLDAIAPETTRGLDSRDEQAVLMGELQDDRLLLTRCADRSLFPSDCRALLRQISRRRLSRRLEMAE